MAKKFEPELLIAIPLLGGVGGGYLSFPVLLITREKEPWSSIGLLLGFGLVLWLTGS